MVVFKIYSFAPITTIKGSSKKKAGYLARSKARKATVEHEMAKLMLVTHVCITNLGENVFLLKYKCKKFF